MQRIPLQMDIEEAISLRLPTEIAKAVERDPAAARAALRRGAKEGLMDVVERREVMRPLLIDVENFLGYSKWLDSKPWCSGFYEVKQRSARDPEPLRLFYDALTDHWSLPKAGGGVHLVAGPLFVLSHLWRGIASPASSYPYPLTRANGRVILLGG